MKKILVSDRIRKMNGGFSFIPARFLTEGFLESLPQKELLLYLFLVIVSDRNGLSYYSYDRICTTLEMDIEDYIEARNSLIRKDLIAFDGTLFQVLELPSSTPARPAGRTDAYDAL
ncbi:MAG: helix-turn-helix domain-containing protein [Syntrophus sp. (in: bacteria)]